MSTKLYAAPDTILPNPQQPRSFFDASALDELASSMRTKQRQPITVIPWTEKGTPRIKWMIVDGERRWRAAAKAGLKRVWIVVDDDVTGHEELHTASFTANWCRAGHTHAETARAIQREHAAGRTLTEIGAMIGKSDTWVSNELSLLKLHPTLLALMDDPTPRDKRINLKIAVTLVQWPIDKQVKLWERFRDKHASTVFHELRTSAPTQATNRRKSEDGRYIESQAKAAGSCITRLMHLPPAMTTSLTHEQRRKIVARLRETAGTATRAADLFAAVLSD